MFRGMVQAKSELFCINDIHFFNKVRDKRLYIIFSKILLKTDKSEIGR